MLSVATATELLTRATSVARLGTLAAELGFEARSEEIGAALRERLSLPHDVTAARVARGPGALRALLVEIAGSAGVRQSVATIAAALARHAPHSIWLVVGHARNSTSVFIATWLVHEGRPQLRALTADRHHVYASDADTLCALSAARDAPDVLVHVRWSEILGRDSLTRRFYAALRGVVRELAADLPRSVPHPVRDELALLNVSRLLFLAFLQTKGWLNGDHCFLDNAYARGIEAGGRVHPRVLEPLFFGTLNTRAGKRQPRAREFGRIPYLNGGLFARAPVERRHRVARFSDEALGVLFGGLLSRYRFTPQEEIADWSDTAVDPVILGRAFESLMEQSTRKSTGTYYTPPEVVERATRLALEHALAGDRAPRDAVAAALDGQEVPPETAATVLQRARALRLLDPACGSGAFLVHALRVLADLRVRLGSETHSEARRSVLGRSIFGVDVNPTAVWLCELRLWLSLAVECRATDPLAIPPLPNLDRNIRVGDSLAGAAFASCAPVPVSAQAAFRRTAAITSDPVAIAVLRGRYTRAQGPRKRTLARSLDAAERRAALAVAEARLELLKARRREMIDAVRSHDLFGERHASARSTAELARLRQETRATRADRDRIRDGAALAFSFDVQFSDVAAAGGFDAVVGNPPWVRPHHLAGASRTSLRARFEVCRSAPAGTPGDGAGGVRTFGAQVDLAAPFVERSLELLRPGGALALLVPAKLWCSLSGGALRRFVTSAGDLLAIEDFSAAGPMFDAATYPSLLAAAKRNGTFEQSEPVRVALHRRSGRVDWETCAAGLRLAGDPASPWVLVPPPVRRAFERLAAVGRPLRETRFGAPRLGVKTGCNDAFVVTVRALGEALAEVHSGERHGWVERALLRPVLRGELVRAWNAPGQAAEHLIWTHDGAERPLSRLPSHATDWLRQWRATLAARTDGRGRGVWWQLFRTPAARTDRHRVVWNDIGRAPRACVLQPGDRTVPINTCYVAFADEDDAWALAALLNGPLAPAWLNIVAEPARGGYRRYFAWTMAALPLPRDEDAFRASLAPLGRAAAAGSEPAQGELLDAALAAYRVRKRDVAPLLEWRDV